MENMKRKGNFYWLAALCCVAILTLGMGGVKAAITTADITDPTNQWTLRYSNSDGYYEGTTPGEFIIDLGSQLGMEYNGSKTGDFFLDIFDSTWNYAQDTNNVIMAQNRPYTNFEMIDYSQLPEGKYVFRFSKHVDGHHNLPDTWSVLVNIERVDVSLSLGATINPESLSFTPAPLDATLTWTIKNSAGEVVLQGSDLAAVKNDLLNLPNGDYSVEAQAQKVTSYGHTITDTTTTTFQIRRPLAALVIDAKTNPTSLTASQTLPDSTLSWVIKDQSGQVVKTGTGSSIDIPTLPGTYSVFVTEESTQGLTSEVSGSFTILADNPTPTTTPTTNPTQAPTEPTTSGSSGVLEATVTPTPTTTVAPKPITKTGEESAVTGVLALVLLGAAGSCYLVYRKIRVN